IQQNRQKMDIQLPVDEENRTFQLGVAPLGGALKAYPGQLITLRDITDQKRFETALQKMAITDPLTGLFNRRQFFDLAEHELERSRRYGHPMSLIILDIDDFKRVNDHYGHRAGDQVLQTVTQALDGQLRDSDIIGRYGGEEFTILLPETDAPHAVEAAERLRQIAAKCSVDTGHGLAQVTISLGVVCAQPSDTLNVDQILEHADRALYSAKHNGRNQACLWVEGLEPYETNG
ncbi:MAG TPA: GGDEF domain-containing protein, partial [Anaerolineaceae bacterium]|nr:GGDEF domain-containing protein [Anaerolineaceae bacterium]